MKQGSIAALLAATVLAAGFGVAAAQDAAPPPREPLFRQGPCGGLFCSYLQESGKSEKQVQAEAAANPQNCGGLMCDMGMRAFPTQAQLEAQAAARAQEAAPPAPEPTKSKKARRRHVAKAEAKMKPEAKARTADVDAAPKPN